MLSDIEIMDLIESGKLQIEYFDVERLGPVSYDIETVIDSHSGPVLRLVSKGKYYLSRDIIGIIMCRSRIAKLNLFATFSPLIDPGYKGKLIFAVYHPTRENWARIEYGDLFQVGFEKIDGEVAVSYDEREKSTAMNRKGF